MQTECGWGIPCVSHSPYPAPDPGLEGGGGRLPNGKSLASAIGGKFGVLFPQRAGSVHQGASTSLPSQGGQRRPAGIGGASTGCNIPTELGEGGVLPEVCVLLSDFEEPLDLIKWWEEI